VDPELYELKQMHVMDYTAINLPLMNQVSPAAAQYHSLFAQG